VAESGAVTVIHENGPCLKYHNSWKKKWSKRMKQGRIKNRGKEKEKEGVEQLE
jgi:hypothetical protein